MKISELLDRIMGELGSILRQVDEEDTEKLLEVILSSDRIFLVGMGRSGLMAHPFAMRLMQIGLQVYIVGDATTPAIREGDLLIAISRSGETRTTYHIASTAKNLGALVFLITSQAKSSIANISDLTLILPDAPKPVLPLGSAFESAVHVFLDSVVILVMKKAQVTQGEMIKRHSNLE